MGGTAGSLRKAGTQNDIVQNECSDTHYHREGNTMPHKCMGAAGKEKKS